MVRWEDLDLHAEHAFDESGLDPEERGIWHSFPDDLRRVLTQCNGAVFEHPYEFPTKLTSTRNDGSLVTETTNSMTELWAFLPRSQAAPTSGAPSILHQHFGRHIPEDFLPSGVYVFGRCEASCLVAVSTNPADYGAIYYWEWYWTYPWFKPFFEARLAAARARWPNRKQMDERHPDWPQLRDDFNYATLVQLASSFDAWLSDWVRVDDD
jgi:hypothetical protein